MPDGREVSLWLSSILHGFRSSVFGVLPKATEINSGQCPKTHWMGPALTFCNRVVMKGDEGRILK